MDSLNIVFSIIFAMYQMLPWKDTREIILKDEDLIKLVLGCLRCDNEQINFISMRFLEIIQLYDSKWSEKIKKEKFRSYNNELINKIQEVQTNLKIMSNYIEGGMYDDPDEQYIGDSDDDEILLDNMAAKGDPNLYNYQYYN